MASEAVLAPVPAPSAAPLAHGSATRARILHAAMLRFAQYPYEEARLRDIAADAGVDVAHVHRSFGSKALLFQQVLSSAFQARKMLEEDGPLAERMVERLLEPSLDREMRLIDPLDIVIRSLLSREAIPIIREALLLEVVEPLSRRLPAPAPQRAALLAACLGGISLFRNVLRVAPLQDDESLRPLVHDIITAALGEADKMETA
ncbi:TetR/AcrR family transcriptional regulator [Rhodovarius lipocyclicus]|uniref:TetR/AcrR family transcriptional regulator n=1 Tax=Rhodovarius lipocyclicus TaxID=268410 RepID=UPI00135A5A3D|nr:TetR/AcrR family transcriptional regulator [Rhodovarius lipocyclicus]